jgi:hypothetical protein
MTSTDADTASHKLSIEVEQWRGRRSGTLYGFATIRIPELHLRIIDCPVHAKNDSRWAPLPAKPQINKDGNARCDEHGKVLYATVIEFTDRPTREAFSTRVIDALLTKFPKAFGDEKVAL